MKKKYIRVERSDTAGGYIDKLQDIPQVIDGEFDDFEYLPEGTQLILTVVEMEESEFENLPEFEGWQLNRLLTKHAPDACPACRGKRYVKIGMYHEVCEACNGTGKRR